MMDDSGNVPPRNILTGELVKIEDDLEGVESDSGLTLTWKDLSVWRKRKVSTSFWRSSKYEHVEILHNVSGMIQSGSLTAVMGPSGAGKTTLLAAISRRDNGRVSGTVLLNGRPATAELVRSVSGFVPQHDVAIEDLTVSEHMAFMARLMMDRRSSAASRAARTRALLAELGVARCGPTQLRSLSGGERKRVSLAVQLLNDPGIIFCDEPTSGLDSWAARAVAAKLRAVANAGKAVVCTIHQPASGLFQAFDRVLLLAAGHVAYQGDVDGAVTFFNSLNLECPIGYNPAEFYVSQVSQHGKGGRRGAEQDEAGAQQICDAFSESEAARQLQRDIKRASRIQPPCIVQDMFDVWYEDFDDENPFKQYLTIKKPGFFTQFIWLYWRLSTETKRNNSIFIADTLLYLCIAVMLAIPYMGILSDLDQRGIQDMQGLLYLVITETVYIYIYSVFNQFPRELPVLLRDIASGLYSPAPYYLSKIIFLIPRAVIEPTVYSTLIFVLVGLRGGWWGWFGFTLVVVLSANVANAYGLLLSASFKSIATAALVSVPVDLLGSTFSGLFLNLSSVSILFVWVKYLSIFYYGIEAISILQWHQIDNIKCNWNETVIPCTKSGRDVLNMSGFSEANFNLDIIGLFSIYFACHVLGYVMLCRRSKQQAVY